jgi:hypothetical protein
MMIIRILRNALIVAAIGLSGGCASQPKLRKEARAGINSVSINTEVDLPERTFWGVSGGTVSGDVWLDVATGIIAKAAESERERRGRAIQALMVKYDINPGKMVAAKFKEQLKAKGVFPDIVDTDGDAAFTFKILGCGFHMDRGAIVDHPYRAVLSVNVRLEKPDGTLIWENRASARDHWLLPGSSGVDAYSYHDYTSNPSLIRAGFKQGADRIVRQLLKRIESN